MNSRDRLRTNEFKKEIESNFEQLLSGHEGLRKLRAIRRQKEIEDKLKDSKPLADVLTDIIKKSPSLSSLFLPGHRLKNPFNLQSKGTKKEFEGRQYPTYFRLVKKYSEKKCPINQRFRVKYETDVDNDYFDRDVDPGEFILLCNGEEIKNYSLNMWNGIANLTVEFPEDVNVGDKLTYRSNVKDITISDPFDDSFSVIVEKEVHKMENSHKGKRIRPPSKEEGDERAEPSGLALPNVIEVYRDKWDTRRFDEKSGLEVIYGDGEYDFFVNMDNIYLLTEKKNQNTEPIVLNERYKDAMTLIGLALLKYDKERKKTEEDDMESGQSVYDQISNFSEAVSPVLLPMISSLGDLQISE
jgi:hypothetical protein